MNKEIKTNFQTENLVVDWISFNIEGLLNGTSIGKAANYLSGSLGVNCLLKNGREGKAEILTFEPKNQIQAVFYCSNLKSSSSYWRGTILSFAGQNAADFYKAMKEKRVDWNMLEGRSINLGRLDLYYFRNAEPSYEKEVLELFMKDCCEKVSAKSKTRHTSWSRNFKGLILKIGSR